MTATLDALWSHPELCIRRALVLPIQHALLGVGRLAESRKCSPTRRPWRSAVDGWPSICPMPCNCPPHPRLKQLAWWRAVLSCCDRFQSAAREHGLDELAFPVNDVAGNRTRFLLLRRGQRSEHGDVASLAFSLHRNAPGALLEALACLAERGLNMSRIESRPSKRELGEYVFFVDVDLPPDPSTALQDLIAQLQPLCEHLAHFGAYPSSDLSGS